MGSRIQNMNRKDRLIFAAGNVCLSVGLLLRLFVHPVAQVQKNWLDGVVGLLLGMAIAINLGNLYKSRRCATAHDRLG